MTPYRLPAITAADTQGQLRQLRSYLYQLVEELNLAQSREIPLSQSTPAQAAAPQSPGAVFAGIKSLIIKSADIVEAYYEQMERRFSGAYVARGDYGTFTETTSQQISENAAAIERNFTDLQQVTTDMAGIEKILVGVNAYINAGLLYYEGETPVYGIEVGQRTETGGQEIFNKYARFTSGKLSFYDRNDNEVAYISDYQLSITNALISGSFRMGHLVDTVQSDGSVVTKFSANS